MTFQRLLRDLPLRNNIYAFNASRTRFYPYQFKPLLKFLDSPRQRLLVADEVGLGKTIEAGLVLTELRARQTIHRVLVVCPANLTQKWQIELKRRFGEGFTVLKKPDLLEFLEEYQHHPEDTHLNGIISMELIRRADLREPLEAVAPGLDLVVVDEAHHMRNPNSQRKAGVLLSESSDAMLLLTATPIHLGNQNLYSLLNLLDRDEFPDFPSADHRFRRNEPIVKAQICLGQVPANITTAQGLLEPLAADGTVGKDPLYSQLMERMEAIAHQPMPDLESRRLLVRSQRDLASLNLLGHILTRTRKREVQSLFPVRKAYPHSAALHEAGARILRHGDTMSTKATSILDLSVAERIQMVEDIWDSIAAVPDAVPLSDCKPCRTPLKALSLSFDRSPPGLPGA